MNGWIFFCSFNNLISFSNHFTDLQQFLFPYVSFDLSLGFLMSSGLESVGVYGGILSISKWIIIKRSADDICLSFNYFSSDFFHLFFQSNFMLGLFFQSSHHFIDCFVSFLFQGFILFLLFGKSISFLFQITFKSLNLV